MKPLFGIIALLLIILAVPHTAQAQTSRLYMAGYFGLNKVFDSEFTDSSRGATGDMKFKNAPSFAGALGLRLSPQMRLEGEISYSKSSLDRANFTTAGGFEMGGDLKTTLYMLNLYYDFDTSWADMTPFVSAGFGLAQHSATIEDLSGLASDAADDSIGFAWQLGSGLKYRVNPNMAFIGGYRYVGTSDITAESYELPYGSHELRIGIEYDIPVKSK